MLESWKILFSTRRFFIVFLLGFSSGLPIALTASALEARYAEAGVDLVTIGMVTLVGVPYVFKFLWAPILDRFALPLLSRRRGWMLVMQLGLVVALIAMALLNAQHQPLALAMAALTVAILSATQDIAIDAYRTEILHPDERGIGMAYFVAAYRVAMLVASSIGFIVADKFGWQLMYLAMAGCMGIGILATLLGENERSFVATTPQPLYSAFIEPLKEFFTRSSAIYILLFVLLYKFGDAFAAKMMTTFFVRGIGFSKTEIGMIYKFIGFFSMLFGAFIGGIVLTKTSLYRALMAFGVLQAVSNLMFVVMAYANKDLNLFALTVAIEQFAGGMGTSAFLALIMALCNQQFTATQFASLTALSAVPREFLGPIAGYLVQQYGWAVFYEITFIFSFPGLLVLWLLKNKLPEANGNQQTCAEPSI